MNSYVHVNPETGEIVLVERTAEQIIERPNQFGENDQALMSDFMVETQNGVPVFVERPKISDVDLIICKAGEEIRLKVSKSTRVSYTRPDLPLTRKGRVQRFDEKLTDGIFSFMSQKPGTFEVSFTNCFPFREQIISVVVGL